MHSLLKISESPLNKPPPLEVLLSPSSRKIYHDNDETHECHRPSDMVREKNYEVIFGGNTVCSNYAENKLDYADKF